jgi:hypothetical protein
MLEEYAARIFGKGIKDDIKKRKDTEPTSAKRNRKH